MPKAFWNGAMIAQSNLCRVVDGKYYFPPESIRFEFLRVGNAEDAYDIEVDGAINPNGARNVAEIPDPATTSQGYFVFGDQVSVVD